LLLLKLVQQFPLLLLPASSAFSSHIPAPLSSASQPRPFATTSSLVPVTTTASFCPSPSRHGDLTQWNLLFAFSTFDILNIVIFG
jgi:hypothetical protein